MEITAKRDMTNEEITRTASSIVILQMAKQMRSEDWIKWAGNSYSSEEWERRNPIELENLDYVAKAILKYLDLDKGWRG